MDSIRAFKNPKFVLSWLLLSVCTTFIYCSHLFFRCAIHAHFLPFWIPIGCTNIHHTAPTCYTVLNFGHGTCKCSPAGQRTCTALRSTQRSRESVTAWCSSGKEWISERSTCRFLCERAFMWLLSVCGRKQQACSGHGRSSMKRWAGVQLGCKAVCRHTVTLWGLKPYWTVGNQSRSDLPERLPRWRPHWCFCTWVIIISCLIFKLHQILLNKNF